MPLDERKRSILKAVVDDYIQTAEPVGSKNVVKNHDIHLSSATVRNIMAELEKTGYLVQPHTSAGRVPSDKGYREYVDSLMVLPEVSTSVKREIERRFDTEMREIGPLLKQAAGVLSETTGYTALAVAPYATESHLKQLKILMIEPGRALIVVVMSEGLVKNRLARVPRMLTLEQLMQIAQSVESGIAGLRLDDITLVTIETTAQGIELPDSLLNQVLYEAYVSIKQAENLETYTDGIANLFRQPEFQNVDRAGQVVNTLTREGGMIVGRISDFMKQQLDESPPLKDVTGTEQGAAKETQGHSLSEKAYPDHFMIRIGQEIAVESLESCSFVTTTYMQGDRVMGNISVVGPKRMSYNDVISKITFVRDTLERKLCLEDGQEEADRYR